MTGRRRHDDARRQHRDVKRRQHREVAAGPVVGMTEAALLTAALVSPRFTVITMPPRTRQQPHRVVRGLGLGHRCVVQAVQVPVHEVAAGAGHLLELFADAFRRRCARMRRRRWSWAVQA